jgi:hypothetical protein
VAPKFELAAAPTTKLPALRLGPDNGALADPAMAAVKRDLALIAAKSSARIPDGLGQSFVAMAATTRGIWNRNLSGIVRADK